jgi:hypothetical protein
VPLCQSCEGEVSRFEEGSFAAPAGMLISIICVGLCLWLLLNSGWLEARDVFIATAVGLVIYGFTGNRAK